MFRTEKEFKIVNVEGGPSESEADFRARWVRTLQQRLQDKAPNILETTLNGRQTLYYAIAKDQDRIEGLTTVQRYTCIREDLAIVVLERTVTQSSSVPGGTRRDVVTVVPDPRAIGVDAAETARLMFRVLTYKI